MESIGRDTFRRTFERQGQVSLKLALDFQCCTFQRIFLLPEVNYNILVFKMLCRNSYIHVCAYKYVFVSFPIFMFTHVNIYICTHIFTYTWAPIVNFML